MIFSSQQPSKSPSNVLKIFQYLDSFYSWCIDNSKLDFGPEMVYSKFTNLYNGLAAKGSHITGGKSQKPVVHLKSWNQSANNFNGKCG